MLNHKNKIIIQTTFNNACQRLSIYVVGPNVFVSRVITIFQCFTPVFVILLCGYVLFLTLLVYVQANLQHFKGNKNIFLTKLLNLQNNIYPKVK